MGIVMAGFYTQKGDDKGGTGLPEGHWMHGAMAKEKARLAKKGNQVGAGAAASSPASVQTPPQTPVKSGMPC